MSSSTPASSSTRPARSNGTLRSQGILTTRGGNRYPPTIRELFPRQIAEFGARKEAWDLVRQGIWGQQRRGAEGSGTISRSVEDGVAMLGSLMSDGGEIFSVETLQDDLSNGVEEDMSVASVDEAAAVTPQASPTPGGVRETGRGGNSGAANFEADGGSAAVADIWSRVAYPYRIRDRRTTKVESITVPLLQSREVHIIAPSP